MNTENIKHRNRIVIAIATLCLASQCSAADLSLGPETGSLASGITIDVTLASSGAVTSSMLSGVQFDLAYDSAAYDVTVTTGAAADNAGKTISAAPLKTSGQRILVIGFNQKTLTDGTVAIIHVSRKAGIAAAALGVPIRLTSPAATTTDGTPVAITLRTKERIVH